MKVLKFYADWCAPCKMLSKVIEGIDTQMAIEGVDIDQNREMAMKFGIRSVPTCVLVDDSGSEVARHVGMMTESEFHKFIGE